MYIGERYNLQGVKNQGNRNLGPLRQNYCRSSWSANSFRADPLIRYILMKILPLLAVTLLSSGLFVHASNAQKVSSKPLNIAVIIKATDSDYWEYMTVGAENYAKTHPNVRITVYGPPSETDAEQQVSILENVIAKKPDGILIASISSDAPVPDVENAMQEGIPVVTVDNRLKTKDVAAFLATDNLKAGALAADQLVQAIKAVGEEPKGKIGMISAYAGVQVLTKRDDGFTAQLHKIAPELHILPVRYINNDVQQAMSAANDLLLANQDIVGFFGDNNHSGDGVALALSSSGKAGKVPAVAFDSDPQEVKALGSGVLSALIVQDPYEMGYKGMDYLVRAIHKEKLPAYTDTGAYAVTKANMNEPKMKGLLNPLTLKK
jgi:ribose transport system substrate-binding protein